MPNKGIRAGPLNFNERTAYIGALPLLLAVGTIGRRRPREQWFFVALAVVLIATIYDTPVWSSEVRDFPEVNVFALGRLLIVVSFAGAVLSAAYGLQRWLDGSVRERRQMLVIMGSGALIPPLIWLLLHLSSLSTRWSAIGSAPDCSRRGTIGARDRAGFRLALGPHLRVGFGRTDVRSQATGCGRSDRADRRGSGHARSRLPRLNPLIRGESSGTGRNPLSPGASGELEDPRQRIRVPREPRGALQAARRASRRPGLVPSPLQAAVDNNQGHAR